MSAPEQHVGPTPHEGSCWSRIGIGGDRSCSELVTHAHCRNCPVYRAGATRALDIDAPRDYVDGWTAHFAKPRIDVEDRQQAVVIFRVSTEWLALPAGAVTEIANIAPVHTLPHFRGQAILGVANVRGSLITCLSLDALLTIPPPAPDAAQSMLPRRLIVVRREETRVACPVAEVHGIHRVHLRDFLDPPTTVAKSSATYSVAVLRWHERSVGVLDPDRLCRAISKSVA